MTNHISYFENFLPENKKGIYLIGGSVRDYLIGKIPADFDIVTDHNISMLASKIAAKIDGKIIPIGEKTRKIIKIVSSKIQVDIAYLQGKRIENDISKRDFTINAIAYDFFNKRLIDPTNGFKDITLKKLKMVNTSVFRKDPIRLLRAYRIALNLNFSLATETKLRIASNCNRISSAPGEKIWFEFLKILNHANSADTIADMATSGLIFAIFSNFLKTNSNSKNNNEIFLNYRIFSAYKNIEFILSGEKNNQNSILHRVCKKNISLKNYALLKYTLLLQHLCDFKNSNSKESNSSEKFHFEKKKALKLNQYLKLSSKQDTFVKSIINNYTVLIPLFNAYQKNTLTKKDSFLFFEQCGSITIPIISCFMANTLAKTPMVSRLSDMQFINFLHWMILKYEGPYSSAIQEPPILTGHDLIKFLHMKPSPKFKKILNAIHIARISGEILDKDSALEMAEQYAKIQR